MPYFKHVIIGWVGYLNGGWNVSYREAINNGFCVFIDEFACCHRACAPSSDGGSAFWEVCWKKGLGVIIKLW